VEDIHIKENTLFPGLARQEISAAICFPYAQHYIADSPGCYTKIKDREELISMYNRIADSGEFKTFSARTIINQVVAGIVITAIAVLLLSLIF